MKDKILILFLSLIFKILFITNTLGEEIKFEANVIEFLDKDKKIIAEKNVKIFIFNHIYSIVILFTGRY